MGEYADYEIENIIEGFERRAAKQVRKVAKKFVCQCGKRFTTDQGLSDHKRDTRCGSADAETIEDTAEWANRQMTVGEEQDFGA